MPLIAASAEPIKNVTETIILVEIPIHSAASVLCATARMAIPTPVSYTHLDVYKRQVQTLSCETWQEILLTTK